VISRSPDNTNVGVDRQPLSDSPVDKAIKLIHARGPLRDDGIGAPVCGEFLLDGIIGFGGFGL
jgi:hypothetical protein